MSNRITVTVGVQGSETIWDGGINQDLSREARIAGITQKLQGNTAFFRNVQVSGVADSYNFYGYKGVVVSADTDAPATQAQQLVNLVAITVGLYFIVIPGQTSFQFVPGQIAVQLDNQQKAALQQIDQTQLATSPWLQMTSGDIAGALNTGVKELANVVTGQPFDAGIAGGENPDESGTINWGNILIYASVGVGLFLLVKFVD